MHEKKTYFLKKENLWLYLVLLFFLLSGIWYSHSAAEGDILMGEAVTLAELEEWTEPPVGAEALLAPININSADVEELMRLDGIGEKRAEDIIAYREANGLFQQTEDIMKISGIGEKTFEGIKEYITIE